MLPPQRPARGNAGAEPVGTAPQKIRGGRLPARYASALRAFAEADAFKANPSLLRPESYAFVPVNAMPWTNCFWKMTNTSSIGQIAMTEPAISTG